MQYVQWLRHRHREGADVLTAAAPMVLIVDDDPEFRDAFADSIRLHGYQVETATNGVEALDKLCWGLRPRVIFLDLQMQVMTGWDFRAEQKAMPELAAIPVVAMTAGYWKNRDLNDFSARIVKPFDVGDVLKSLQPILQR